MIKYILLAFTGFLIAKDEWGIGLLIFAIFVAVVSVETALESKKLM